MSADDNNNMNNYSACIELILEARNTTAADERRLFDIFLDFRVKFRLGISCHSSEPSLFANSDQLW